MSPTLVLYLQRHRGVYWAVFGELGFWLLVNVWKSARETFSDESGVPARREWTFPVLVILVFSWGRFCSWWWPLQNTDEAQAIATALTLRQDPRFWLSVDAGSHGPLVALPLVVAGWFAPRIDFWLSRVVGTLLLGGSLCFFFDVCARRFGALSAKLSVVAALVALTLATSGDFLVYNGEMAVDFTLALGVWLADRSSSMDAAGPVPTRARRRRWLFAAGAVIGLVPWVKLQGLPLAAVVAVIVILVTGRRALPFVAGTLCSNAVFLLYVAAIGALPDFYEGYVRFATSYVDREGHDAAGLLQKYLMHGWMMRGDLALPRSPFGLFVFLAGVTIYVERSRVFGRRDILACLLFLIAGLYAVIRPGNPFPHYFLLLTLPFVALMASSLSSGIRSREMGRFTALAFFTVTILLPVVSRLASGPKSLDVRLADVKARLPAEEAILRRARPGDKLVVWGWMSAYHVATQLPQGVRYSDMWQLWELPHYPNFERTFLRDLSERKPRFFLDVASAGMTMFHDPVRHGVSQFPGIVAILERDYELVEAPAGHRLYVRRDRSP